jgi:excinuclease UvrABC nuclease subunit
MEREVPVDTSCQISPSAVNFSLPHPFLCSQKMSIHEAKVSDIASIDGISEPLAREIYEFIKKHPFKSIDALDEIKGVGKNTLEQLKMYFSDEALDLLQMPEASK